MALILLWLGGLSFAGCIVWATLSGPTIEAGLATLASVLAAGIGFRCMGSTQRLKGLEHLGYVYLMVGIFAFFGFLIINELFNTLANWAVYVAIGLMASGFMLAISSRRRMKKTGLLFDLRRVDTLSRPLTLQENIKCEGYEVVTGFSQYGPSLSQRGRIFLEHEAQLPCIIKAKGGSVGVYELSGKKPASHVKKALLRDLAELVASLEVASKEIKGRVIEVTPVRTSVLLKKYELAPEELASICQDLLRVEAIIDQYTKGKAGV